MSTETDVVVICGEREAQCECVLPKGHEGLHACDEGCGGSWGWDEEGRFVVGSFPSMVIGAGRHSADECPAPEMCAIHGSLGVSIPIEEGR